MADYIWIFDGGAGVVILFVTLLAVASGLLLLLDRWPGHWSISLDEKAPHGWDAEEKERARLDAITRGRR